MYFPECFAMNAGISAMYFLKPPKGTSNNCHRSSGAPNLPTNDSALFSFRFCAVHPKDLRDSQLRQLFEVPLSHSPISRAPNTLSFLTSRTFIRPIRGPLFAT